MDGDGYLLRARDREELSRLELQHRVWKVHTDDVLRRADFGRGDRLLDIGSGPGFLTFDLADLVGPAGSVFAIDSSPDFILYLRSEARRRQLTWIRAEVGDAAEYDFEAASYDGAIVRWLLMFLPEPERVIARVAESLRPGGVFAAMEYVQFRSMSLWPRGERFEAVYAAVHELISRSGGNPDIGGRIPELVRRAGLEVVELLPIVRVGRPGSPMWDWLDATGKNHSNLVEANLITTSELDAYYEEWRQHSADPAAFFTSPPILATVARRG
jgi:ubiquinone/menaquinone biosynthesis C-methylase UbiE